LPFQHGLRLKDGFSRVIVVRNATRYAALTEIQQPRVEIIGDSLNSVATAELEAIQAADMPP